MSSNAPTTDGSKPRKAARNASRLLRIVCHDRPAWKASSEAARRARRRPSPGRPTRCRGRPASVDPGGRRRPTSTAAGSSMAAEDTRRTGYAGRHARGPPPDLPRPRRQRDRGQHGPVRGRTGAPRDPGRGRGSPSPPRRGCRPDLARCCPGRSRDAVGGHSYGGRVASLAAAEPGSDYAALVLFSYPLHPPGAPERAEARVAHWPRIGCPVLLLSGESDPFARIELLRTAVGLLPDARLVTYPRLGHTLRPCSTTSSIGSRLLPRLAPERSRRLWATDRPFDEGAARGAFGHPGP